MIFVYKVWDEFCKKLFDCKKISIPACRVLPTSEDFVVLKHDVETDVAHALAMAKIEAKYGHKGSFYVQAYLLEDEKNVEMLRKMQAMGHEISYHYDVMDFARGEMDVALEEFEKNRRLFEENGFALETLCQHGNPVVERVGYTSNRDFFRSERVRALYPHLSDIMVNFKEAHGTDYTYFSDAGRQFKLIFDPITNDLVPSDDQNIPYENIQALLEAVQQKGSAIISTHPHRWTDSAVRYRVKAVLFRVIKTGAKVLMKIPFFKKIMSRYYYLAKKI